MMFKGGRTIGSVHAAQPHSQTNL